MSHFHYAMDAKDFPHAYTCPACREANVCSGCGQSLGETAACSNGRCAECCTPKNCHHLKGKKSNA
jgi:hypothetical protein